MKEFEARHDVEGFKMSGSSQSSQLRRTPLLSQLTLSTRTVSRASRTDTSDKLDTSLGGR